MDLALLIQSENVQVAIQKSREHIPVILKEEVNMTGGETGRGAGEL